MPANSRAISTIYVPLKTDLTGWGKGLKKAANDIDKFYAAVAKTKLGRSVTAISHFGKGIKALTSSLFAPLQPFAKGITSIASSASSALVDVAKLGAATVGVGLAIASTMAVAATGGLKRIGDLGDTSLQLGIASDKLSELQFAAISTGASAETLNTFVGNLSSTIHDSIGKITPASDAFRLLGTSAEELTKLSPDQQFAKLKSGLDSLPDSASKANAAIAIGGESGLKLMKLLGTSAQEFEALKQKSKDLGFTVSPESLAKVQEANQGFSQIGIMIEGVVNQLTVALAPAIGMVAKSFTNWFANVSKDSKFFDSMISGFIAGIAQLADTTVNIAILFKQAFATIGKAISQQIDNLGQLLKTVGDFTSIQTLVGIGDSALEVSKGIKTAADETVVSAQRSKEAFEKAKPSTAILKAYGEFSNKVETQAKVVAENTKATQQAATANRPLIAGLAELKQSFREKITNSGLIDEYKQINSLKGLTIEERKELAKLALQAREAGKRDSLAEELRESTKLPQQVLTENLNRIGQLFQEGKINANQAIRGAAQKSQESGLAGGTPQFGGAIDSRSIEGRSFLLRQFTRQTDPTQIARQGLALTGQTNNILTQILNKTGNVNQQAIMYR